MCVVLNHQGQHFVQEIATLQSEEESFIIYNFKEESFIIHQLFRGIT